MEHLSSLPIFMDAIVNAKWTVKDFANAGPSRHRRADVRESSQKIYVIQKRVPKSCGRPIIVLADKRQQVL
jgi:hypothetical protein